MKNDSFTTPEILDVTAVELAKLQQEGDTKRKQIAEREITIREKSAASKSKWTDNGFLTVVGLISVAFILTSGIGGYTYINQRWPDRPKVEPCVESFQVVRDGKQLTCSAGGKLEAKPVGDRGDIEMRCVCGVR